MKVRIALRAAALLASPLWWAAAAWAADSKVGPELSVTPFASMPQNLNYFEDSDVILFHDFSEGVIRRSADAGKSWGVVDAIPAQQAARLVMHRFDASRAYVLTEGLMHYRTEDRGATWKTFVTEVQFSVFQYDVLGFHASDPDRVLFNGMDCQITSCEEVTLYTIDGFRSAPKLLRGNTGGCWWARSSDIFSTGDKDLDANRVLCIVRDARSPRKQDQRLVVSDSFFAGGQEFEPNLDGSRAVQGVVNVAAVKKYLLVATTSVNTDEMALFVTDDTLRWHRAEFPADHRVNQEAYTVLESTNYSIQIDVMTTRPSDPMGVLFTSNSNGTFFTRNLEYTNRNLVGHVDFEKISGIQGIFLVNRVENGEAVAASRGTAKRIVSEITFDDGRTFAPVRVAGSGDRLHLHSVTELRNVGRIFSSPAPGLVMGVGNTGETLGPYADGRLYISDDAGVTWMAGPDGGPYKYEFGDQGSILVAVRDTGMPVDEVVYSLDHGQSWQTAKLPDGLAVRPWILTTTQDSTSLKFLLLGDTEERSYAIALDFAGLHAETCTDKDMEDWWARVDDKGEPTCLMGHKQKYRRRKKTAACFLKQEFRDPVAETTDCDCTDLDFECDYNFRRSDDRTECLPAGPMVIPEGACAKPEDTFSGSSGWRLIPGNTCRRTSGAQKDAAVERKCSESGQKQPSPGSGAGSGSGKVAHTISTFDDVAGFTAWEKHYLERGDSSSASDLETVIMRPVTSTQGGTIRITHDHGKTWAAPEVFQKESVWGIFPHEHFKEVVFFVTQTTRVIYTVDHGEHWHEFEAPFPADMASPDRPRAPLVFHPDKKDWLIWVGRRCEGTGDCYVQASYSQDRGDSWHNLLPFVEHCEFIGSSAYKNRKAEAVLCLARAKEGREGDDETNPVQLVSSNAWFADDSKVVHADNVKGFASMAEFIVVAAENREKQSLRALASLDGVEYAEARFPPNFEVPNQREYTVLDSSTHAINLFVATETATDQRYGTILKSNSNGTMYVMSIGGVNCDNGYYVDFEKVLGLEGVVLVNVVANAGDKKAQAKQLQTLISHNDGAEWAYLPPPMADVDGKAYGCRPKYGAREGGDPRCGLHLHGYTEREDHGKTFSSEGAVGLLFGVGNVGAALGDIAGPETDTFMTTDAGLTWRSVRKGAWTWQFGDQGSIVVLVPRHAKTRIVAYTTDEGATWKDYEFSDTEVLITDITTLRSGASRNFLLWCSSGDRLFTVNLDFSGLADRACEHNDRDLAASDYYLWSPSHPLMPESQCLFGHVSQYLRKKTDRSCYNGYKIQHIYNTENCTCSRRDYECDYNFELDNHGQCSLVPGLQPLSKEAWCAANPDAVDYYPPTGFRRIPLTTCQGGTEFDKTSTPQPCQKHEDEFRRKHRGPGPVGIFFAVVIPVAFAAVVGWYVYRNWSGKLGAIRLGEHGAASRFTLDADAPWIKYPVMAAAAAVAVASTVPLLAMALWRSVAGVLGLGSGGGARGAWSRLGGGGGGMGRFTTRDSFARGRGDYAVVDDDEGELLGDESDEEV